MKLGPLSSLSLALLAACGRHGGSIVNQGADGAPPEMDAAALDPLFLLQVLEVTEFVWYPVVRVEIQSDYMKARDPSWVIPLVGLGPSLSRANR